MFLTSQRSADRRLGRRGGRVPHGRPDFDMPGNDTRLRERVSDPLLTTDDSRTQRAHRRTLAALEKEESGLRIEARACGYQCRRFASMSANILIGLIDSPEQSVDDFGMVSSDRAG